MQCTADVESCPSMSTWPVWKGVTETGRGKNGQSSCWPAHCGIAFRSPVSASTCVNDKSCRCAVNLYTLWKSGEKWRKGDTVQLWKWQIFSTKSFSADHGYFITLKHVYMSHVDITAALFLAKNRSRTYSWLRYLANHYRTRAERYIYIYINIQYIYIFNQGSLEKRACGHFCKMILCCF